MGKGNWIKTLVAVGAFVAAASVAQAFETAKYEASAFKAAQSAGAPILVHVTAPWCPTCTAQHNAIDSLSDKADFAKVKIFDVDFDTQKDVWKGFSATTQSTLIAFKGTTETGRLVGATSAKAIDALVQSTLK
ncbi:MAG: thioredoxin family protein [Hyphomicrobium sp.]